MWGTASAVRSYLLKLLLEGCRSSGMVVLGTRGRSCRRSVGIVLLLGQKVAHAVGQSCGVIWVVHDDARGDKGEMNSKETEIARR